jgi:hypothetical protein
MNSDLTPSPNPRKTASIRRLGPVAIRAVADAVLALPEHVWDAENDSKPNRFSALDSTRHIVFRFVTGPTDWRDYYDRPLWADWADLVMPVLREATAPYGYANGEFPRIMLARMAPGGFIQPHRDANAAAKWPHKIHVPLQTNDAVTFTIDGKAYHLPEGEAVEVNNMATHAVENRGSTDRIHLIFEYFDADQPVPRWAAALAGR